jgi:hypothetical protein
LILRGPETTTAWQLHIEMRSFGRATGHQPVVI